MAFSKLFVCDKCDQDVVLVHAEEWALAPDGSMVRYRGSGLIGGLMNQLWCPTCRLVRQHAFVVLYPPAEHAVVAYAEAQRLGCNGAETGPCAVCTSQLTWHVEGEACPSCIVGRFQLTGEWEDAV